MAIDIAGEIAHVVALATDIADKNFIGAIAEVLSVSQDIENDIKELVAAYPAEAHAVVALGQWLAARWPRSIQAPANPDAIMLQGILAASNAPG